MDHLAEVKALRQKLEQLCDEMKAHAEQESADPKCAALCETSAEVLSALVTAHTHYLEKSEKAWE